MPEGGRRTSKRPVFGEHGQDRVGQFLAQHNGELVFKLDAAGRVRFANEAVRQELGMAPKSLAGKDFFTVVAPHEGERLGRVMLGERQLLPAHGRAELRAADGTTRIYYCTASRDDVLPGGVLLQAKRAEGVEPSRLALTTDGVLALFAQAPYAIFLSEPAMGRILQVNELATQLTGYGREKLIGRELVELFPTLDAASIDGGAEGVEGTLVGAGGRTTPVELSVSSLLLEGRQAALCFVRNLTREKQAELERAASEARFKTSLDRLIDGFCLLLPVDGDCFDFRFTYANPAAREMLLIPSGESDRHMLRSRFDWETGERLCTVLGEVLQSGRDVQLERVELTCGTAPKLFALHAFRHGAGVAMVLRDETQRTRDAEALISKERGLSSLLANLPMGVAYQEIGTGRPPLANSFLRNLLGLKGEEQPNFFATGLFHDLAGNPLKDKELPLRVVIQTGQAYHSDRLELRVPGREPCRVEVWVNPIIENARIAGVVAVIANITSRVALEQQLSQSQRMQALGTLAGGIAHDFNNVAQAISGSLELAKRALTSDHKAFANISAAQKAAARVTSLTGQLLSASSQRLEAMQTRELGPLIIETASLLRGSIDKRIAIETAVPPRLWPAIIEPGRTQQCLINLALNARDAIDGAGTITISAENVTLNLGDMRLGPEAEPGEYVAVSVRDTGKGIPPEIIGRIFEPFFTTKQVGKGTGLGLAVVYANMKQLGGFASVTSSTTGATFTLFFRRGKRFTGNLPQWSDDEEDVTQSGTERVLVVDDEPEILDIASEILTDVGYSVDIAQDGEAALERLRQRRDVDLVLLDLTMPRQGGAETLKVIREENLAPCVVVMSGFASGLDTEGLIKLGADAFLPKPYSLSQLTKVVREQLDLHK